MAQVGDELQCRDFPTSLSLASSILLLKVRGKSVNGRLSEMTWQLIYLVKTEGTSSLVAQMVKNSSVMQETWVQSLGQKEPLEKEMTTHSSILAWRIPWTEEPGRLYENQT